MIAAVLAVGLRAPQRPVKEVEERFERAIHERDRGWGSVSWDDKAGVDAMGANVDYRGDFGAHTFEVSMFGGHLGQVSVNETWKGGKVERLLLARYENDRPDVAGDESNCKDAQEESRLRSLASQLEHALYEAMH